MKVINKDSLGARVKAYLGKPKHANVEGVSDQTPFEQDSEGENDAMDPWNEIHSHLDKLRAKYEPKDE